jgi:two-component system, OmpR family, response regulator
MRILIAEDDAPLADFICEDLRREQFTVYAVADGVEAQELASNQNYDLVILDLTLPGAPGLDVLRGIRSIKPDLPVLIITGATKVEERVCGLDAGADDYVLKPFVLLNFPPAFAPCFAGLGGRPAPFYRSRILNSNASLTRCSAEVMKSP